MNTQMRGERKRGAGVARADYPYFDHKLRSRWETLRGKTREVLLRSDNEHYSQIAGQVHDVEDESLADLLVDVNLARVSRDVQEIREIEDSLKRLALGTYGVCVRCKLPIERGRLEAYPTARRCATCQREYEKDHSVPRTPSI
jgi:RNA polymerase-binding transcription factor DksA